MTPDHLNRQIETARQRLETWRKRAAAAGMDAPTRQALEQLDATLKELGMTAGELHSRNEQEPHESERFAHATIDALSAHICVLDESGIILAVNQAWRVFAEANPPITQNVLEGANYLAVCDTASGEDADIARAFAAGLRAVIQGERDEFSLEYPCHSPTVQRWFNGRVTRLPAPGSTRVVIAHENITERKLAETALLDSERRFRTLAAVAPAGIYVTDARGQCVYTNPRWCEMTGLAPEQTLGLGSIKGLHPDDRERIATAWHNLVEAGGEWGLEYRFQTPEGKTTWVLGRAAPLRDGDSPQSQVTGYVGINLDITARKQMEAMLRASEEQYRRIVETAREGIWMLDAGGKTTFVNQRMLDMLGYMAGEMLSAPLFAFVDEKEYARAAALLERCRQGIAEQYEFKFRRRDGTDLWAIVETTPITDEHGKYNGALAMVTDITERKRAEQASKQAEEEYKTILHTAMDGFTIDDMQGRILDVNDAYCRLTGYTRDELLTMRISDVEVVERWEETAQRIKKITEVGWDRFETRQRCKDGRIVDVEISVNYINAGGGRLFVFARDITERKRAEEALRESEANLSALLENTDGSIWSVDGEYRMIVGNARFRQNLARALGRELQKGDSVLVETLPPEYLAQWREYYDRALRGEAFGVETLTRFLPEPRYMEYRFRPIRTLAGAITGVTLTGRDMTERKRTEEMVRQAEEKYRSIFENAVEGIYQSSPQGRFTSVNSAMARILGYASPDEVITSVTNIRDRFYADPGSRTIAMQLLAEKGTLENFESECLCKDGSRTWLSENARAVEDVNGTLLYYEGFVQDIAERKRAEEALRESEELYRQTITSISDTVFLTDDHGHFILVCPNVDLTFGWSADEAMAMGNLRSLIGASPFVPDELEGELRNVEWEILDKSGQPHSVLVHIKRVHIGAATRLYTCRDITERKREEKALQESEERFRCLSEASFEGIAFHDEGKIIDANQAFATMFGYGLSEMIGKNALDFATPELREAALRHIRTGSEEPYEGVAIRKNGSTFPVQVRGKNALFIGRSVRLIAMRDITERKRAEEALRESEQRYRTISELTSDFAGAFRIEMDGTIMREWLTGAYSRITGFDLGELDTHGFWITLVHPDDMPAAVRHLRTLFSGQPDVCELRIVTASGQVRWLSNYGRPVWDAAQGRVIRIYSASQDITGRKRAEEALRQRSAELALLNRAGQAFSSTLDLDTVIHTVLDEMRQLFQVVACSIWLCDPDTGELVCQQSVGPQSELVRGWRLAPGQGVAGWAVRASESVIVEDAPSDPRHYREVDLQTGLDLHSILAVPLRAGQRVTGVIEMVDNQTGRFKAANVTLLEALAAEAGLAIENARLYGHHADRVPP